jgi:hypothetical protein
MLDAKEVNSSTTIDSFSIKFHKEGRTSILKPWIL